MSPKHDKSVLRLVEKYRRRYPHLERSILRKLIRLENKGLFYLAGKPNESKLKTLDRHLKKAFEQPIKKRASIKSLLLTCMIATLAISLFSILQIANLDYSLKLLNNTIINPLRTVERALTPMTLLFLATFPFFYTFFFREWVKSRKSRVR